MGKITIREFQSDIYPRKLWVCLNATEKGLLEQFDFIPHGNGLADIIDRNAASVSSVIMKDGCKTLGALIFTSSKKYLDTQTIAHESVHIADYFFECLGMSSQQFSDSNEPYAYLVGWAAKCIVEAMQTKQQTVSAESLVENK